MFSTANIMTPLQTNMADDRDQPDSSGPPTWSTSTPKAFSANSNQIKAPEISGASPAVVVPGSISVLMPETVVSGHHNIINRNSKLAPKERAKLCKNNNTQLHNYNNVQSQDIISLESKSTLSSIYSESNTNSPSVDGTAVGSSDILCAENPNSTAILKDYLKTFRTDLECDVINPTINRPENFDVIKVDELKEIIRCNMDKYKSQELNTILISCKVRRLLLSNSIGQRIFAKYVVGLSQGTVSDLLSKPKPWSKLTEKGKDSYRKMYAWASDEKAILLLKSFVPKKRQLVHVNEPMDSADVVTKEYPDLKALKQDDDEGKCTGSTSVSTSNTGKAAAVHVKRSVLGKTNKLIKVEAEVCTKNEGLSPSHSEDKHIKRDKDDDNILQQEINKIYQEGYMDQITRTICGTQNSSEQVSSSSGLPVRNKSNERIQMLDMYRKKNFMLPRHFKEYPDSGLNIYGMVKSDQERLNKISHQHLQSCVAEISENQTFFKESKESERRLRKRNSNELSSGNDQDEISSPKDSHVNIFQNNHEISSVIKLKTKSEAAEQCVTVKNIGATGSHLFSNSSISHTVPPAVDYVKSEKRSAFHPVLSFNKSLLLQYGPSAHHVIPKRPTKVIPPPITQEQFEMFSDLDTEDTVRKIKDILSKHPITQRLFGESVLGLSQGSVSDLLTHPKSWHMLTQKGREPYIRMKMFLEDEKAVNKLGENQYNTASVKFVKSSSCSNNQERQSACKSPETKFQSDSSLNLDRSMMWNKKNLTPCTSSESFLRNSTSQSPEHSGIQNSDHTYNSSVTKESSADKNLYIIPLQQNHKQKYMQQQYEQQQLHEQQQLLEQQDYAALQGFQPHSSHNMYEFAALTQELDTHKITSKVKDTLLENQIGQKIFGEAVLGLSQGSVSELLSKPKQWHLLSIKGREPYIRMSSWLSDPHKITKIYEFKRKKSKAKGHPNNFEPHREDVSVRAVEKDRTLTENSVSDFCYTSRSDCGSPFSKKQRIILSEEQKEGLRLAFSLESYPSSETIGFLQNELALSSQTITDWFKNNRQRLRDQGSCNSPMIDSSSSQVTHQSPPISKYLDPLYFRLLLNQRFLELHNNQIDLAPVPFPYFWYMLQYKNLIALNNLRNLPSQLSNSRENICNNDQSTGQNTCLDLSKHKAEQISDTEYDAESEKENGSESSEISSFNLESVTVSTQTANKRERTSRRKSAVPKKISPQWNKYPSTYDDSHDDQSNGIGLIQKENYKRNVKYNKHFTCVKSTASSQSCSNEEGEDSPSMESSPKEVSALQDPKCERHSSYDTAVNE